jgi:hypothetical protein
MTAVMAESAISDKDTRFNLAVMVGSAMYHAERLADAKFEKFRISKKKHYKTYVEFPNARTAKMFIQVPNSSRQVDLITKLSRPVSRVEQFILTSIALAHNSAAESIGTKPYIDLLESFLERMDGVIIDTAVAWFVQAEWNRDAGEIVSKVRRFMESLMTANYEHRASEIGVTVTRTKKRPLNRIDLTKLLLSKKTSSLFAGHRHLLVCNVRGEIHSYVSLPPYPDTKIAPRVFLAPYEYQPVVAFSHKRKALTFVLTRRREIMVIMGSELLFVRDERGWRIIALDRFMDILTDLLWRNSKKRLAKWRSKVLAVQIGMLCLSLRHRGRGGIFVISRSGVKVQPSSVAPPPADEFYNSLFRDSSILEIPVSMICNAAGLDGATFFTWDGKLERFGAIINTERLRSTSEGARTRAAEFISSKGIAIKVSEDGPITIYTRRKARITI